MKQLYVLFGGIMLTGGLMAQTPVAPKQNLHPVARPVLRHENATRTQASQSTQSTFHAYMSPTNASIDFVDPGNGNGTFTLYVDPLFQDSSVTTIFGTNPASHVTSQKLGGDVDPKSTQLWNPSFNAGTPDHLSSTMPYTIDTVWIAGAYSIIPAHALAGDTIQVELTWGLVTPTPAYFQGLVITAASQNFTMPLNTTSLNMGNHSFSTATAANKVKLTYILTALDTISVANNPWDQGFRYIAVVPTTPINIPANNIVAVQYTYCPASSYNANDVYFDSNTTSTATMNSFLPYIWEETGLTTGNDYFYDPTSRSISGVLDNTGRYGQWPSAQSFLNGCMLPFTNDGLVWGVSVSASSGAGIAENLTNNFALEQNIPNPTNGMTTINYSLNAPSSVSFNIVDITGKTIMSSDKGNQSVGKYTIDLNTADYAAGVYFYTLTVNGQQVTRRLVVTE